MLYPIALMQFCLGLGLLHVSFLTQKIWDDFIIHPVDENWSLVLVSVRIYFAVLSTFYGCIL